MSNVFTINPIKINIFSLKNTIKQTVIFIGIVPKEIKHELKQIEIHSSNLYLKSSSIKILQNFYGNNWIQKLGITYKLKKGGTEHTTGQRAMC